MVRDAGAVRPEQAVRRYLVSVKKKRNGAELHFMEHRGTDLLVYDALRSQDGIERRPEMERGRPADLDMVEWRIKPDAVAARQLPENTIRASLRDATSDGGWHLLSDITESVWKFISDEQAAQAWSRYQLDREGRGYTKKSGDPSVEGRRLIIREAMSEIGMERQMSYRQHPDKKGRS